MSYEDPPVADALVCLHQPPQHLPRLCEQSAQGPTLSWCQRWWHSRVSGRRWTPFLSLQILGCARRRACRVGSTLWSDPGWSEDASAESVKRTSVTLYLCTRKEWDRVCVCVWVGRLLSFKVYFFWCAFTSGAQIWCFKNLVCGLESWKKEQNEWKSREL